MPVFSEITRNSGVTLENFVIPGIKVTKTYIGMITIIHGDDIIFK
jgi:hypothetical protein